jgi:hypothetical protein
MIHVAPLIVGCKKSRVLDAFKFCDCFLIFDHGVGKIFIRHRHTSVLYRLRFVARSPPPFQERCSRCARTIRNALVGSTTPPKIRAAFLGDRWLSPCCWLVPLKASHDAQLAFSTMFPGGSTIRNHPPDSRCGPKCPAAPATQSKTRALDVILRGHVEHELCESHRTNCGMEEHALV